MIRRSLAVVLLAAAALAGDVRAETDPEIQKIWADPQFKEQFLGSYGIHPDVEPKLSTEERAVLEKVYPLLSSDPSAAERELEAATTPQSTALFDFVLGNLALQGDRAADAKTRYQSAVTKFPSFRRAWKNLGLVEIREGSYAEAIGSFTKMIELGGADALSYGLLGYAYSSKGDPLAAETAYRNALLLDPENQDWRLGLVRAVVKQEKYEEAVGLLRVLIEKHPERVEFWILQANAFIGMKQPLRAAENLEIVARMDKATPDTMNLLGDLYVNEDRPDLAARAYVRGIQLDPAQPTARVLRAVDVLAARGYNPEAESVAAAAREAFGERLTPEDQRKLLKLKARLDAAQGRNDEAAQVLEEVVALDPLDGEALLLLGQHYARANEPEKALMYLERAAGLDAFEAQAKAKWAQILVGQKKYDEALPLLKRARELKPSEELSRYVEQVERVARTTH